MATARAEKNTNKNSEQNRFQCCRASVSVIDLQMTSKCGKNKKVAHEAIAECVTDVTTF